MRAAGLVAALEEKSLLVSNPKIPLPGPRELPFALTLRHGWGADDLMAVVGLSRGAMGHLHADGGQVIVAWHGRCWLTDPGYQQYRPGDERDYTLGPLAHNMPVVGGIAPSERLARLERLETDDQGRQHARVDMTREYKGLPPGASIQRDVWLLSNAPSAVVVKDTLAGLAKDVTLTNSWQGGHHFAWAFRGGWVRLSDGARALWLGTVDSALRPAELKRHPGSRGPLTLTHGSTLIEGKGTRWWVFVCDPASGWEPPAASLVNGALNLKVPGSSSSGWSFQ
jgi:hypothetical protein